MLITIGARLVRSHGEGETALPGSGRIEYRPAAHGIWEGALRGTDTVVAKIVDGVAETVDLTPGPWRVSVHPDHGARWDSWLIELEPGMPEPVDLADLAPVIVVDGEKWAAGPPGPSAYQVAITEGFEGTPEEWLDSLNGDDGRNPSFTWDGTRLVIDGQPGPDLEGEPGAASTVPGPPPTVSWDGTTIIVDGTEGPDLQGVPGPPVASIDDVPGLQAALDGKISGTTINRDIRPLFPEEVTTNRSALTRVGPFVTLSLGGRFPEAPSSATVPLLVLPVGYRPTGHILAEWGSTVPGRTSGRVLLTSGGDLTCYASETSPSWCYWQATYLTADPWPKTFPGDPA